jgi:hypothetical protein
LQINHDEILSLIRKGNEKYRYSGKYEKDALVEWMKE